MAVLTMTTLRKALSVEAGETRPVTLMMSLGILIGFSRTLVHTAGFSLFLASHDASELAMVYVIVAVVAASTSTIYLRLADRLSVRALHLGNLLVAALATVGFWGIGASGETGWPLLALPVWYETLYVLTTLAYWNLAGRVFNVQQGKRLFGLIGTGDRVAEVIIGVLTPLLVWLVGASGLLGLAALFLLFALVPAGSLLALIQRDEAKGTGADDDDVPAQAAASGWRMLRSRYVMVLVTQVVMTWLAYYAVDLIFYGRVELHFTTADEVASFIGLFFGAAGFVGLLGQSLLTSRILSRIGVRGGLVVLPFALFLSMFLVSLGNLFGSEGILVFVLVCVARFCASTLLGIVDAPAGLMLYQPLPIVQRTRIQGFIDGIVYPISVGLTGVVLYVLQSVLGFGFSELVWSVVLILSVWVWTSLRLGTEYPKVVRSALDRRLLDDQDLREVDATSLDALCRSLKGEDVRQVLYAIQMLSRITPSDLGRFMTELLAHHDQRVVLAGLAEVENHHYPVQEDLRSMILNHEDMVVRGAALQALCAIDDAAAETALNWLEADDARMRRAARLAIVRHGSLHHLLAASGQILALEKETDPAAQYELIELIAGAGARGFYQPLLPLLAHAEDEVWLAAAQAASVVRHPRLVAPLARALTEPGRRVAAADALGAFGVALLPELKRWLAAPDAPTSETLAELLLVVGRIRDAAVGGFLQSFLTHMDIRVREAAVSALDQQGGLGVALGEVWFVSAVNALLQRSLRVHRAALTLQDEVGADRLLQSLRDEALMVADRLFELLCLSANRSEFRKLGQSLRFGNSAEQALALESLELLTVSNFGRAIVSVLSPAMEAQRRCELISSHSGAVIETDSDRSAADWLCDILQDSVRWPLAWTRVSALYSLYVRGELDSKSMADAAKDEDSVVRVHFERLVQRDVFCSPDHKFSEVVEEISTVIQGNISGQSVVEEKMLPIEKVAVLRGTEIFQGTPDYVLAHLAEITREQVVAPGEVFIHEGALENHMYVVVNGEVEVFVGDRPVKRLGPGTVVGEMQVIDPAPRSASVRAAGDVMLFRIGRAAFDQVMADRPEISRAINRMLVRRLRAAQGEK